jgi:hypothetical protein
MELLSDHSRSPSVGKILLLILSADFLFCILYGIAMEGVSGNLDAQMNQAPAFLTVLAFLSLAAGIFLFRDLNKIKTSVTITQTQVILTAVPEQINEKGKKKFGDPETLTLELQEIVSVARSTKKKDTVLLTTRFGKKYSLLRMAKAEQITKLLTDKLSA